MRKRVSCAKVELPHNNLPKGDHIPHEQEYSTRHILQVIPNEVCGEIRRQPRQPEVQQEPVVYLLLEAALGRKCGVPGLPVQTAAQSSESAHGGRVEAHPSSLQQLTHETPPLAFSRRVRCPICLTNLQNFHSLTRG